MKNNQYIKIIIFFSSFALFGFLVVQIYWARNTFIEKKDNYENLIKISVQEIGDELREKILNESKYFNPNIGTKSLSIKNTSDHKSQILDSLILEINTISEKSITEKRKEIFSIINSHFALNLNINVDNSFNKNEVIAITNNSLESNGIDNDFHFTITDESGVLIL